MSSRSSCCLQKFKITKILKSEENLLRKFPNEMAKSNAEDVNVIYLNQHLYIHYVGSVKLIDLDEECAHFLKEVG